MAGNFRLKVNAKQRCLVELIRRLDPNCSDAFKFMNNQIQNVFVCLRNGIEQPWFDWKLKIDESNIPQAGRGLFLDGHCPAGRLLCFYSGQFWPESDITDLLDQLKNPDIGIDEQNYIINTLDSIFNNHYTFTRENGTLIDGTPCEKIHERFRKNPLCLGYIANHPSVEYNGNRPNLLAVDVPWEFVDDTKNPSARLEKPYIPTWYKNEDRVDDTITCFIAMRDLKDEELFFDYELETMLSETGEEIEADEPNRDIPPWFTPVDYNVYLELENENENQDQNT